MKTKIILSVAALSILITAVVFVSCKKENNTPPTITLLGQANWTIFLQANVTDPGATAVDNSGNDLTASIVSNWNGSNPNQNSIGTYTITYFVSDVNGNTATKNRIVTVTNSVAFLNDTKYSVTDVLSGDTSATIHYTDTVFQSTTMNNTISINNFGGFGAAVNVIATLNNHDSLIIPPQTPTGMLHAPVTNGLHGYGTFNSSGIIKINYTVDYGGTPDRSMNGSATYTKVSSKK